MSAAPVDVEVHAHGSGGVWFHPVTERALGWYFGHCPHRFWRYFHMRLYADTGMGWYVAEQDDRMAELIKILLRLRMQVEFVDLELSEDDPEFRRRLKLGDFSK